MEKILMGGIVGFVLLTFLSYIFFILRVPYLIIPTVIILAIAIYKSIVGAIKETKIQFGAQTVILTIVFIIGIAGQLAVISPSGMPDKNGNMLFWSANGHDGAWHIALMEEFKKEGTFQNPIYAGEKLVNYHFFSDILPAMVSKYLPISDADLYFRIFPLIYSLFLGTSVYFLTKKLTNNFSASVWATIFTYFAGSWGYIVTFIRDRSIGGESIFWATQPQSASGNPPQIISDFLIVAALYYLRKLTKKWSKMDALALMLIAGTISEFKIYAGVVLLGSLVVASIWQFIRERKLYLFLITGVSSIAAAALYLPNSIGATSFLIFQPWWYIRTMVVDTSRLNWLDLELRREFYIARGGIRSVLRVIEYEGLAFLIFFFGNLGMRFFGLIELGKFFKKIFSDYFNLTFVSIVVTSLVLPLLFLQKGVVTNTSQFLQYFVLLMGIAGGISVSRLISHIKSPSIQYLVSIIFFILMVPTQAGLLVEFYGTLARVHPAYAKINSSELTALDYIRKNTPKSDIILTPPYDPNLNLGDVPPNIWDWFDTSYVAAFSGRKTYMDDYEQNDIMGYDYRVRLAIKKTIFTSADPTMVQEMIFKTKANIIYFPRILRPKIDLTKIGGVKIYENSTTEVWRIN